MAMIAVYSPSKNKIFYCDAEGADLVDRLYAKRRDIPLGTLKREPLEGIVVDFGGACLADEPDALLVIGDIRVSIPVRQVPTFRHLLAEPVTVENASTPDAQDLAKAKCRSFGGWQNTFYVFSDATCAALLAELDRLAPVIDLEVAEAERKFRDAWNGTLGTISKPEKEL